MELANDPATETVINELMKQAVRQGYMEIHIFTKLFIRKKIVTIAHNDLFQNTSMAYIKYLMTSNTAKHSFKTSTCCLPKELFRKSWRNVRFSSNLKSEPSKKYKTCSLSSSLLQ